MKPLIKVFIFLITIELALQIIDFGKYVYTAKEQYASNKLLVNWYFKESNNSWWIKESQQLIPRYHPFLGYIFRGVNTPNIHIDTSGIRTTTDNPSETKNTFKKIFLFGGSSMFGYGVKDNETIPSFLARKLNSPTPQFMVVNYGQVGYNSNQELLYFLLQLKNKNIPDLAIFYDGCNEITLAKESPADHLDNIVHEEQYAKNGTAIRSSFQLQTEKNTTLINKPLLQNVFQFLSVYIKLIHYPNKFVSLLSSIFRHIPNQLAPTDQLAKENTIRLMVENYSLNINMIDTLSKQYNFKYIPVWQPLGTNKKLTDTEANDTEILTTPDNAVLAASVSSLLAKASIPHFVNFASIFENYSSSTLFFDSCHVNQEGNSIVAERMAQLITETLIEASGSAE
jgi:lysophospholipase L1-like esterase